MLDPVSIAVSIGAAIFSPALQVLLDQIVPHFLKRFRPQEDAKEKLRSLERTLLRIQALLADVEMRVVKDRSLALWLLDLKGAAYDLEDVLDEFAATLLSQVSTPDHKLITDCLEKIEASRSKLDAIVKERSFLSLGKNEEVGSSEERVTSSFVDISSIIGRGEAKKDIIKHFMCVGYDESEPRPLVPIPPYRQSVCHVGNDLCVLPIVGMGGIGKTTLAQFVYNDGGVEGYFPLRMWVCVSDNFDVKRVTREMLEAASGGKPCALTNWDTMQSRLKSKLEKKRFLFVLDDMRCEDYDKWEMLHACLLHGKKGSRVVITTRDGNVAKLMGILKPYVMEGLSEDDSCLLFRKCAFPTGGLELYPRLEAIGKEIVKKLNGSPLAVKTIGRLLKSKPEESIWRNILESEMWELQQDENDILPILRLSYQHLPAHLKLCFSSCSIFSKGYKFDREKLVQIWMAQGLIPNQGKKLMEDIGSEYFNDLCSRYFFHKYEDTSKKNPPQDNKYVIHDLMHDMAKFVSLDEFCTLGDDLTQKIPQSVHHISLICNYNFESHFSSLYELKNLRTLLFIPRNKSNLHTIREQFFDKFQYLRVLDLSGSKIQGLSSSISKLTHLRFIDLSNMESLLSLPPSLTALYNLQTLKLLGSSRLSDLPKDMGNLINLRHLEAHCDSVADIVKIGKLTSLQRLELFKVRKEYGFEITELKGLSQLHGCLCIRNLENVEEADLTNQSIMSNKKHLGTLKLTWEDKGNSTMSLHHHHHHVLEGLRPHANLKKLTIEGYGGMESPTWMVKTGTDLHLCNLVTVHLSKCRRWKKLPPLGDLQLLKYLRVSELDGVEEIDHKDFGTFPSLQTLQFTSMAKWEKWSGESLLLFPALEELAIDSCPKLMEMPPLSPTLSVLKIKQVGLRILPGTRSCNEDGFTRSLLSELEVADCTNLTSLSQLQHLKALKTLILTGCKALTSMLGGWFEDLISLEKLTVQNCPHLTVLSPQSGDGLPSSLRSLDISDCPGLVTRSLWGDLQRPSLQFSIMNKYQNLETCTQEALCAATTLRLLRIRYIDGDDGPDEVTLTCNDVSKIDLDIQLSNHDQGNPLISCLRGLTSICQLEICKCTAITALSSEVLGCMTALTGLSIYGCEELVCLEFHALPSLTSLVVEDCPKLMTCLNTGSQISGDELVSPLESLDITGGSLFATQLGNLTSLTKLVLVSCPERTSFTSEEEQWLTTLSSLQELKIVNCDKMVSLPAMMQNLKCLVSLHLIKCPEITTLSVTCLPSTLKGVYIDRCPLLTDHCITANWPVHIDNIWIDGDIIRGS